MAYILLMAVRVPARPWGWGCLWGWLLGAGRKELGLCHGWQLEGDLGLPQPGTGRRNELGQPAGLTSLPWHQA